MNYFKHTVVIFRCHFCVPLGAENLIASKLMGNFNPRIIKTNCSGRVDSTFILDAFAKGVDGVIMAGNAPGSCHFIRGNYKVRWNIILLKSMLPQLGIEPDRLEAEWITRDVSKFLSAVNNFTAKVTSLGPLKAQEKVEVK